MDFLNSVKYASSSSSKWVCSLRSTNVNPPVLSKWHKMAYSVDSILRPGHLRLLGFELEIVLVV